MKTLLTIWTYLNGKKTALGVIGLFATFGFEGLGFLPTDVAMWLKGIFGTLAGVGVGHKFSKKELL